MLLVGAVPNRKSAGEPTASLFPHRIIFLFVKLFMVMTCLRILSTNPLSKYTDSASSFEVGDPRYRN